MLEGMAQKNLAIQAQSRKRYKDFCKEQKTSPIRSKFYCASSC